MKFAHAKPAWVFPRIALFEVGASDETVEVYGTARVEGVPADTGWRPGLWTGTAEKGPRAGWHCGVWWDDEGKQHAFMLPPDHVDLQPKPPTLAKPERTP
jgi:hypothetical protein